MSKLIKGVNDLASLRPDLIAEWNDKNVSVLPNEITTGSHMKVWWKCDKGHEWQAEIKSRVAGRGCPICANKKALKGYNDLKTTNPALACEWNYDRNVGLSPEDVLAGSHLKVWWKCTYGHEWQAEIKSRVVGNGCPVCANQKLLVGYNDLATTNPELAKEWNYNKNVGLTPSMFMENSNVKVWWRCRKGHEWFALISNRNALGRSCPICAKEMQTSFPEYALFFYLRKVFPDVEISNMTAIGEELDIYIPSRKIAIEYDGLFWHKNANKRQLEERKDLKCKEKGILLYRIREKGLDKNANSICIFRDDINNDKGIDNVLIILFSKLGVTGIVPQVEQDRNDILEEATLRERENSIQALSPELVREWNYERNKNISPDTIPARSNRSYWWKCSLGHEWKASPNSRTGGFHTNCPFCSNRKVLIGFNDLATTHPSIALEWNYEKNNGLTPEQIVAGSNKKVWWKCANCGHEWIAIVTSRTRKSNPCGCIRCSIEKRINTRIDNRIKDKGSLEDNNPELAAEWNYVRNEGKTPDKYLGNSNAKVWWKCKKCGNEWEASIINRNRGRGCPLCSQATRSQKRSIPVINIDSGDIFPSITDASQKYGINPSSISACCRNKKRTAGGVSLEVL